MRTSFFFLHWFSPGFYTAAWRSNWCLPEDMWRFAEMPVGQNDMMAVFIWPWKHSYGDMLRELALASKIFSKKKHSLTWFKPSRDCGDMQTWGIRNSFHLYLQKYDINVLAWLCIVLNLQYLINLMKISTSCEKKGKNSCFQWCSPIQSAISHSPSFRLLCLWVRPLYGFFLFL